MAISYNTSTSQITVTSPSTVRNLYDNIQTTFATTSYMQYLIPMQGTVLNQLYTLINSWTFASGSVAYLNTGALQDAAGNNLWNNIQTLGAISNGTLVYVAQGNTVSYLSHQYSLSGSLTAVATTVPVTVTIDSSEPTSGYIQIDSEVIAYTGYSGSNFTGCTRGATGTTAATHASAAVVYMTGHINAELQVKSGGTSINGQSFIVYARKFQQTYSQFSSTGGAVVSNIPLSTASDPNLSQSISTITGYSDLTAKWETIYRSAFDGPSTTFYTLSSAITNSATSITVATAIDVSVPTSGTFQIDSEVIAYTGWSGSTFTGCTRGQYDTTAATHAAGAYLSTNTKLYNVRIATTNTSRRIIDIYNWVQYKLLQSADMDSLSGGHYGYVTSPLVSMAGTTMTTNAGVWVEGFSNLDNNSILYTDASSSLHTPPTTIFISVTVDSTIIGGQVAVYALNTSGLTDATYTPANITSILINQTISSTTTSITQLYSANIPVRVVVRKPGYQPFTSYTTVTNAGLSSLASNPVDGAY